MTGVRYVVAFYVMGLCGCGGGARPTMAGGKPVSHWVEGLKSPDPRHRKEAVEKLGNVGPANPLALPAVCGALKDADPKVRREAVLAVLKFGDAGREAIPALEGLQSGDGNANVREAAGRALQTLRPAS